MGIFLCILKRRTNYVLELIINLYYLMQTKLVLILHTLLLTRASDCIDDSSKPESNCFMHCIINYSAKPQRRYYNITTGNCQTMNGCPTDISKPYYYDYTTNLCYQTPAMTKIAESPSQIGDNSYDIGDDNLAKQFVCVNGNVILKPMFGMKCECMLLWTHSGRLASSIPLMCDRVDKRLDTYFKNLTIQDGQIIKYDNFSASDVQKLLINALEIQSNQSLIYPRNTDIQIQYDYARLLPGQVISQNQLFWIYIFIAILLILLAITGYQCWRSKRQLNRAIIQQNIPPQITQLI